MSWLSARESEERSRSIARPVVLWGMLALMTLLAWLMQVGWVPVGGGSRLTQEATLGPYTVWLPGGWVVGEERDTGDLVALEQVDGRTRAVLQVRFREPGDPVTPTELLQQGRREEFIGIVPMADGEGRLTASIRPAGLPIFDAPEGGGGSFLFTVSAVRTEGGRTLSIQLQRPIADPREWDHADVSLVRRIAAAMEPQETRD